MFKFSNEKNKLKHTTVYVGNRRSSGNQQGRALKI